jgi:PII-like signaling protein
MAKIWRLVMRFKKSDKIEGVSLRKEVLNILVKGGISGATEWVGTEGFGKHGKSYQKIEGITFDDPVLIESIDEKSKFDAILPILKNVINDHG